MSEYKNTLHLPTTNFPMKANLSEREPLMLDFWRSKEIYKKLSKLRSNASKFILHDGPPYANGHLHSGHALNKIPKDIIIKSKAMSGYNAPFVPGWDCHGLPIELNVEKKIGKAGVAVSPSEFRAECRSYASSQMDIQREEFERLGILAAWDTPYATMAYSYEANILRAFAKIMEHGHIDQGFKPVHWCIDCGSALAEAEVDYEDKYSPSIDVAFYVKDLEKFKDLENLENIKDKPIIVPIWTTTPWTLPANEAVALHPKIEYSIVETANRYFLIASDLVSSVMGRYGMLNYKIAAKVFGESFEHILLEHPYEDRLVPIVLGEHVTVETGTGCVHTAPAHGPDDYQVGIYYQLPLRNPVLSNGTFAKDVPFFAGVSVLKANALISEKLHELGRLLHEEKIKHSYPHCWRHKTPVIFRATPQWFISMDKNSLRTKLLEQLENVNWIPDWGKARIQMMIEKRPDWCISRQRAWGSPIPIFVHKETREPHPKTVEWIEEIANQVEKNGIEAWFNLDADAWLGAEAQDYEKILDTLDVWFDSGVSHFCVLKQLKELNFPADLYFEGSDQHRGWFNSSLTTAVAMYNNAPYKTVLTHGYTVDEEGRKLSKSKGNYVSLEKMVKQYGADMLRLWTASTDYRNEVSISEAIIKRQADVYRRIRNTARFLLANLFDFDPNSNSIPENNWLELDKWILQRAQEVQKEIIKAYENYAFHIVTQKIHHFCSIDLGSFYLDIIKDRQYTTQENSIARRSCQTVMYHIIHALTRWLAPILSFTGEEIWQNIPNKTSESVFLELWYDAWPNISSKQNITKDTWLKIRVIRDEINKVLEAERQKNLIGSALEAELDIYVNKEIYDIFKKMDDELRFLFITSAARVYNLKDCPNNAIKNEELDFGVVVTKSLNSKCERCWHRREDVGSNSKYTTICSRCIENIAGEGERREFL